MFKADDNKIKIWPYMLACFALWLFIFRGFIFGDLALDSDAISYYEHIKFYIGNIAHGVFPLWDPLWMSGSPNEFFLRRICPYNPFFAILVLLFKTPIPYKISYLLYLSAYYFLGMSGFYLLSKTVLKNRIISFFAFVFLLFSGLGARLFDSYFLFVSTPLIWFFYFFLNWVYTPSRLNFVGMTFCAMILLSTYIPFYFIVIFATFLIFLCLVYADKVYDAFKRIFRFLSGNKLLVVICFAAVLFSLIPGYTFLKDSNKGDFVFPQRHGTFEGQSQLGVSYEAITSWTSIEDLHYSHNFSDLKKYYTAIHYLPVYLFFILGAGLFMKLNRRLVLMFIWMLFLVVMCSPHAPIYKFLYEHIFFFKYFRNLHFFLWFIITPVFVLFVCEQFRQISEAVAEGKIGKKAALVLNVIAHAVFLFWIMEGGHHGLAAPYITAGLSFIVWSFFIIRPAVNRQISLAALLIVIILQPLELYHYFTKNYNVKHLASSYDSSFLKFRYVSDEYIEPFWNKGGVEAVFKEYPHQAELYYASGGYNFILKLVHQSVVLSYINQKIYLYDNTQFADDTKITPAALSYFLGFRKNTAFVSDVGAVRSYGEQDQLARWAKPDDKDIRIARFNANMVELKLNLDREKFLVLTDSYYPSWKASIDGRPMPVVRANIAFKGLWVPAGEHTVVFRFRTLGDLAFNYVLIAVYAGIFVYLIRLMISGYRTGRLE